jgi:glycosyltransferase involved in cell wall biosynthesis
VRISVIIPAFNEQQLIGETLKQVRSAISAFTRREWQTELIVCDNNSTDATAELARAAGAEVVFEPINQIARARNRGAAVAKGDWLIFIDADSHPGVELFEDVAAEIEAGRCLAGGATVKMQGRHRAGDLGASLWNAISRAGNLLAGSFIFCDAAAFREVGGFSQELFAAEEIDLSRRLKRLARRKGKRLVVLHRHPLLTSARKLHLYSLREHLRFLAKVIFFRRKALSSREACHTWYDGRR